MKSIDALASSKFGISSLTLMENAGRAVAFLVPKDAQRILIFCGKGNNGGDGFVAARHLMNHDKDVSIILLADPADIKGEAKLNFELAVNMGARFVREKPDCDFIIDAIFGIGFRAEVRGIHREAIDWINKSGKPVLAVDIPSGLNADTGEVLGVAVKASLTAALGLPKTGFYKGLGPAHCGQIEVVDIGLPNALIH